MTYKSAENLNKSFLLFRMPAAAPEPAEAAPAVPKTELEELQMKAQHQTDEVSI